MKMLQENEKNCCIWKKNYRRVVGQEEGRQRDVREEVVPDYKT
jgi:hypothetical protein